jgi:hypothetical protein
LKRKKRKKNDFIERSRDKFLNHIHKYNIIFTPGRKRRRGSIRSGCICGRIRRLRRNV